jgi:hypothetical protein
MPSRAVQVGDHVRVPWGLDTVDGVVEDIYDSSHGPRMLVRVAIPGASEEGETITLPADEVQLPDEAEDAPPGTWVTEAQYERKLENALQRLRFSLPPDVEVLSNAPDIAGREVDFVVQSGNRRVFVEVKTGSRQKRITADVVDQLGRLLKMESKDAAGLLVTDRDLTADAQRVLRESPRLRVVRWRGPSDDHRLVSELASLLHEN